MTVWPSWCAAYRGEAEHKGIAYDAIIAHNLTHILFV